MQPDQVWQAALGEFQLQLSKASYDAWLGEAEYIGCDDCADGMVFAISVPTDDVKTLLEGRMLSTIQRTLTGIAGRTASARFVVRPAEAANDQSGDGPDGAPPDRRDPDWARYGVPAAYLDATLADLDPASDIVRSARLQRYLDGHNAENGRGLVLTGPTGTGKTTLSVYLLKRLVRDDQSALFVDAPSLLDALLSDMRDNSGDGGRLFQRACAVDALVLDDLKAGRLTDWTASKIDDLVRLRANRRRSVIVTSNDPWEAIVDSRMGEPTISRLLSSAAIVDLPPDAKDWRRLG